MAKNVDYSRIPSEKLTLWRLISDCVEGETAIKAGGKSYLPDPSESNRDINDFYPDYLLRASFYNATGRTKEGLIGTAFAKEAEKDIGSLDYLKTNADGLGLGIDQLAQKALGYNLTFARGGFLTDYPQLENPASKADNITAMIKLYSPQSIINWDTEMFDGKLRLSLVVLHERYQQRTDDGFSYEDAEQWRVLRLDTGIYVGEVYEKKENGEFFITDSYMPEDGNGNNFVEIPFTFFGAENNDTDFDKPPLSDLAAVNISHYRNSADIEESSFLTGQATPVFTNIDDKWIEDQGGTISMGCRSPLALPHDSDAKMLETSPDQLPLKLMERKEDQMVRIGARLVETPANVTATAVLSNDRATYSVLGTCCVNISEALTKCIDWCALFMGADGYFSYTINKEFVTEDMTPQRIQALIQLWQSGTVAKSDVHQQLRKSAILASDRTTEQIEYEVSNEVDTEQDSE